MMHETYPNKSVEKSKNSLLPTMNWKTKSWNSSDGRDRKQEKSLSTKQQSSSKRETARAKQRGSACWVRDRREASLGRIEVPIASAPHCNAPRGCPVGSTAH